MASHDDIEFIKRWLEKAIQHISKQLISKLNLYTTFFLIRQPRALSTQKGIRCAQGGTQKVLGMHGAQNAHHGTHTTMY